ncbi:MAG TPA: hypothetical protein VMP03_03630 [Methylomirabilota bacterium]|nr:hypothetical protein [Methylomirabilota bacterium]
MPQYCVVKEEVVDDVVVGADVLHASTAATLEVAIAAAESAAKANQHFGFDEGRGAWWGRNTGSFVTRFTAVELVEARRMIDAANRS